MKLEFLKELYFHEWERRAHLLAETSLPTTVITAVLGATFYLVLTFPARPDALTLLFAALVIVGICFDAVTIYQLYKAIHDHEYSRLGTTRELAEREADLQAWHQKWGQRGIAGVRDAEADFEAALCARFIEATDINREISRKKGDRLHEARKAMLWALISIGLAFAPYLAQTIIVATPPARIQLEEPVGVVLREVPVIEEAEGPAQRQPIVPTVDPPAEAPPPKPTLPPNESTYEDKRPIVTLESTMAQQEQGPAPPAPAEAPPPKPTLPPNESIREERPQVEKR